MSKKEIKINGFFDLYDLNKGHISKKDVYRDSSNIYMGQEIVLYDDNNNEIEDGKKYVIVDYIEFFDKNNQIVYACLEDLREQKIKELGI